MSLLEDQEVVQDHGTSLDGAEEGGVTHGGGMSDSCTERMKMQN